MKVRYLIMAGLSLVSLSAWATEVGHVMFTSGEAYIQHADGQRIVAEVGQIVQDGDRIVTDVDGYVHLKMIDNAFYSLRPASRLLIETYRYDPENAQNNQVKTVLETGKVRAITGEAGERNKAGYRLNTPVAAIGVRGTDYIVNHENERTRVAVSSGAVVVSPFNDQCLRQALGACSGDAAVLLTANLQGNYVEVQRDQPMPQMKHTGWAIQAQLSNGVLDKNGDSGAAASSTGELKTLSNGAQFDKQAENKDPNAFTWGRWQDKTVTALLQDDQWKSVGSNVGFLLLQQVDTQAHQMPTHLDKASFNLNQSVAAFRTGDGQWQDAQVNQGRLSMNFREGTFNTQLNGSYAQGDWQLQAAGAVTPAGQLISNPQKTDAATWVNGAINASASQAAYEFEKRMEQGSLVGITHWRAKP